MSIQHRRTSVPNLAPTGLLPGQLGIEMASEPSPRLWCGVPSTINPVQRIEIGGMNTLPPGLLAAQATLRGNRVNGTTFNFSTSKLAVREAVTGHGLIVDGTSGIQCNVNNVGVNGRDQTAAFANNIWVQFYWIYNPDTETLATIASTRLPADGGPSPLPADFTHWCYIGPIRRTTLLLRVRISGKKFFYPEGADQFVLSNAVPSPSPSSFSFAPYVPPNASAFNILFWISAGEHGGNFRLRVESGVNFIGLGTSTPGLVYSEMRLPNISPQQLSYIDDLWSASAFVQGSITITGYNVSNGAI